MRHVHSEIRRLVDPETPLRSGLKRKIASGYAVRTKPLTRQTLRVLVGRGFLFDRLLPRCGRSNILSDAPPLECSQ
jgi:hypothetical protein